MSPPPLVGGLNIFCPHPLFVAKLHTVAFIDIRSHVSRITCQTVTKGVKNFQSKAWPTSRFVCINVNDTAKVLV